MSFSSIMKKVGKGAGAVGNVAQSILVGQPPEAPAPAAPQAPQEPEMPSGFALPDIDPNDKDFEEKNAIHEAYKQLEQIMLESAPDVDYQGEYRKLAQSRESTRPQRREANPLSSFAIAMGAGEEGLNRQERTEDKRLSREDQSWREITEMQEAALKGDIQQKMQKGQFKQALQQSEALARMKATQDRIKSARDAKEISDLEDKKIKGREGVANIKAKSAIATTQARVKAMAKTLGFTERMILATTNNVQRMMSRRATQVDDLGEPLLTQAEVKNVEDDIIDMMEEMAEKIPDNTPPASLGGKPPATTAGAPSGETPEQKALREIRAARKPK